MIFECFGDRIKIGLNVGGSIAVKTRYKVMCVASLVIIAVCMIAIQFVAINLPIGNEPNLIGSITFDRRQMNRVNRIEVVTPIGTTIIEERRLIREIVNTTMVADRTFICAMFGETFIRLYRNDTLVREMEFDVKHNQVRVYRPSSRHWFFGGNIRAVYMEHDGGGLIELSNELIERIERYLHADENSLFGIWGLMDWE